mmetsp:Transcript_63082/g.137079  ORF Transcript_63082/g.137079 Transcript_63082/m.137079 type:complete len:236 (+) Transcript_63082:291-998(+)
MGPRSPRLRKNPSSRASRSKVRRTPAEEALWPRPKALPSSSRSPTRAPPRYPTARDLRAQPRASRRLRASRLLRRRTRGMALPPRRRSRGLLSSRVSLPRARPRPGTGARPRHRPMASLCGRASRSSRLQWSSTQTRALPQSMVLQSGRALPRRARPLSLLPLLTRRALAAPPSSRASRRRARLPRDMAAKLMRSPSTRLTMRTRDEETSLIPDGADALNLGLSGLNGAQLSTPG